MVIAPREARRIDAQDAQRLDGDGMHSLRQYSDSNLTRRGTAAA